MHLSGVISALLLLSSSIIADRHPDETDYLLAVTSRAVGGTNETICVTVKPSGSVSLLVSLLLNTTTTTLLKEKSIIQDFHLCFPFRVPLVKEETVASINVLIEGRVVHKKTTKFLITPPTHLIFFATDKPIYKPGQTVKFRIVSLDSNFFTSNRTFPTIELQDPNSNRIGQWLNVSTNRGLVDLSYSLNSACTNGYYVLRAWKENGEQIVENFEVKDYVLPTFEVTVQFPPVVTILDTNATLTVCAKYTYGKPVNGTVTAVVRYEMFRHWEVRLSSPVEDQSKNYTVQTDKTGCGQVVLKLTEYNLTDSYASVLISVNSEVKEYGTGLVMSGSGSTYVTTNLITFSFEDSSPTFRPGMTYEGKIKMTDARSDPVKRKSVYLIVNSNNEENSVQDLVTDDEGIAKFSLDTSRWGFNGVSLTAQQEKPERLLYEKNALIWYPPSGYLYLQPFYSRSQSYIELKGNSTPFSCGKSASVVAQYVITDHARSRTPSFFYMVMSRGHVVQNGRLPLQFNPGRVINGTVVLTLENMEKLSPVAQVVVYAVLPNFEIVADSRNYKVQPCLTNKVSLNFSSASELPGDKTSLTLKAAAGSLCSVRAVDKSLFLLKPEKELSIESVFNMLPDRMLSGYPYNVYDEDSFPCRRPGPFIIEGVERSIRPYYPYYGGKVDVYSVFSDVGIKILTNADVRSPFICNDFPYMNFRGGQLEATGEARVVNKPGPFIPLPKPVVTVRKYFPETWIWDLVSVSQSGVTAITKTVPDSITTWQADAFCTSPVGFGVAPKTELTAFQPFFVSLTMPSSVIRGEVFTLKATVFNYLQSCMLVTVTLADSKQFSVQKCKNCSYTRCLCADESWTVSWTIKPKVLGKVTISVTAQAGKSSILCGKSSVFVPQKGHTDTIIKTLQVLAEGTKQYKSYNELLCPSDNTIEKTVSLMLPKIIVEDSASASVSVLGDLMGRALQNLASLLAMPYGCGEQNMLLFAPNIFILQYLESTNQLTPQIRSTAETYLISGYQRELTYKHTDGSYSAFGMSDASGNTWLTAFVMKSFGSAQRYIFVDQMFVDQAKLWLGQEQQANGCFASVGQLFHSDMKGGVNDEVTLSAYIVAAMLELNYTTADPVVSKGLACLKNASSQVNSTYAKALLFYTFTLAGDQVMRQTLISQLDSLSIVAGGGRHWNRSNDGPGMNSFEVETASYVLLGLMCGPQISGFNLGYSTSIVRWLSQQQNAFGGFASTQDTVVALQALAKYSLATYSPSGTVTITVTSPSGMKTTFTVNQSNRLLYQESQLKDVAGDYNVKVNGKGCVYVQFTLSYNIPPPPDRSSFSISAAASGNCRIPNYSLTVTITVLYNGRRTKTNMVVIEVRPLSGFRGDKTSVMLSNSNSNSTDGLVKLVDEIDDIIIIYLNGLTKGKEKQYTLTIVQDHGVQELKAAVVKIYDYYETGDVAVTEYPSPCIVQ